MARLYREGTGLQVLATKYGVSVTLIRDRLLKLGVKLRKRGNPGYPLDDLALAYELRATGICWKRIATGLGYVDHRGLSRAVNDLERRGIHKTGEGYERQPGRRGQYSVQALTNAYAMRKLGVSWPEIAYDVGGTANAIRLAVKYALSIGLIKDTMKEVRHESVA